VSHKVIFDLSPYFGNNGSLLFCPVYTFVCTWKYLFSLWPTHYCPTHFKCNAGSWLNKSAEVRWAVIVLSCLLVEKIPYSPSLYFHHFKTCVLICGYFCLKGEQNWETNSQMFNWITLLLRFNLACLISLYLVNFIKLAREPILVRSQLA